ncbi:cytochrome P450 [Longispora fulva]|uniref:Cytochrome P450 n=1 Tax=Longispora fulva TaxID=619741 RepID=A0A8J7GYE4_9ACTN|nr:cytochrome P450 [Longispora fulva]MBG6141569.1 cytochrome P450 [Longispora fulva]GIG59278.1 cytochrome P450 [Longispora fulva]
MTLTQAQRTLPSFLAYLDGLRERGDVHFDDKVQAWQVMGYDDVNTVLTDSVTFSSDVSALAPKQEDFDLFKRGNFVRLDDPEHRKLRGLVSQAFTPKMIAGLEPRIAEVTTRLLDEADAAGGDRFDLIDSLAYPLPFIVIAELLGIPASDQLLVRRVADTFFEIHNTDPDESLTELGDKAVRNVAPLIRELNTYVLDFVRRRRAQPGDDDLTSKLMAVEVDGERMEDEEIVGFIGLLLLAGHVTATSTLGNTVLAFEENPDAAALVRADMSLVPAAIEESLRFRPPFPRLGRTATKDTVLGGQEIAAGDFVLSWLTTANRDERVFTEPDRFDILRTSNPHLTWGKGIHFCLGAPLGRLEVKVALRILMERYSDIRLASDAPIHLRNPWAMIGVNKLPLEVRRS